MVVALPVGETVRALRWQSVHDMRCNAMPCNAMQCNATQRNATQRNATQRNATQRNTKQRNATQCGSTQCNADADATQHNAILMMLTCVVGARTLKISKASLKLSKSEAPKPKIEYIEQMRSFGLRLVQGAGLFVWDIGVGFGCESVSVAFSRRRRCGSTTWASRWRIRTRFVLSSQNPLASPTFQMRCASVRCRSTPHAKQADLRVI
eukprot:1525602-Rhodomonas_salina.1